MKLLLNIIWCLTFGLLFAALWAILGVILCVTIVFIPLGAQCFEIARLELSPFGKTVELDVDEHTVSNIIWAGLIGAELALFHIVYGVVFCLTIVGIPLGIAAFKMVKPSFFPFGVTVGD